MCWLTWCCRCYLRRPRHRYSLITAKYYASDACFWRGTLIGRLELRWPCPVSVLSQTVNSKYRVPDTRQSEVIVTLVMKFSHVIVTANKMGICFVDFEEQAKSNLLMHCFRSSSNRRRVWRCSCVYLHALTLIYIMAWWFREPSVKCIALQNRITDCTFHVTSKYTCTIKMQFPRSFPLDSVSPSYAEAYIFRFNIVF